MSWLAVEVQRGKDSNVDWFVRLALRRDCEWNHGQENDFTTVAILHWYGAHFAMCQPESHVPQNSTVEIWKEMMKFNEKCQPATRQTTSVRWKSCEWVLQLRTILQCGNVMHCLNIDQPQGLLVLWEMPTSNQTDDKCSLKIMWMGWVATNNPSMWKCYALLERWSATGFLNNVKLKQLSSWINLLPSCLQIRFFRSCQWIFLNFKEHAEIE